MRCKTDVMRVAKEHSVDMFEQVLVLDSSWDTEAAIIRGVRLVALGGLDIVEEVYYDLFEWVPTKMRWQIDQISRLEPMLFTVIKNVVTVKTTIVMFVDLGETKVDYQLE